MASDRVVERRRVFQQYKADVKERGKPFFPYAMLHDTIMSFVVVLVIIGLAIVWKYSTPGDHHTDRGGLAREALRRAGRPGNDQLRPAARLVLLLPLLPAADLQVAADGDPRHDRDPDALPRPAARDPVHRRPRGAPAQPAPGRDHRLDPRRHLDGRAHVQGRDGEGGARLGARRARAGLGAKQGFATTSRRSPARSCSRSPAASTATRTWASAAASLGAPDLTAEGAKNKGIAFQVAHLKCPACVNPGSPMPSFAGLGDARLLQLAAFLEASKGPK